MSFFRFLRTGICLVFLASGATHAQDLKPAHFYGTFKGSGFAEDNDSIYFGTTVRDLDVIIAPSSGGFNLTWTTIIRSGGDPSKPNVRRKSQTVTFSPTDKHNVFRGTPSGDPLNGKHYVWGKIKGKTMTVFIMTIDDNGTYNMQSYARTLSGYGMELVFSRIRDGEPVRTARAKLTKAAN